MHFKILELFLGRWKGFFLLQLNHSIKMLSNMTTQKKDAVYTKYRTHPRKRPPSRKRPLPILSHFR